VTDESSTVFEDELKKHGKKCNARPRQKPNYYECDVNIVGEGNTDALDTADNELNTLDNIETESKDASVSVEEKDKPRENEHVLRALKSEELKVLVHKIEKVFEQVKSDIVEDVKHHPVMDERM
jgi:hypothetical protein